MIKNVLAASIDVNHAVSSDRLACCWNLRTFDSSTTLWDLRSIDRAWANIRTVWSFGRISLVELMVDPKVIVHAFAIVDHRMDMSLDERELS